MLGFFTCALACSEEGAEPGDRDGDGGGSTTATGGDSAGTACGNCSNGCCDGDTCVPFSGQNDEVCGTAGQACEGCPFGQACGESGSCETNWDVCSPETCTGCCIGTTECVPPVDRAWDACGADGAVCTRCIYGVICDGTCTNQIASDSQWAVVVGTAEAHPVNSDGNWDIDGSAPELAVCIEVAGEVVDCTDGACLEGYVCDFDATLATAVSGQQLADGEVALLFYDEDIDGDDFAGGVKLTLTEAPVIDQLFEWDESTGMKSVVFSLQ